MKRQCPKPRLRGHSKDFSCFCRVICSFGGRHACGRCVLWIDNFARIDNFMWSTHAHHTNADRLFKKPTIFHIESGFVKFTLQWNKCWIFDRHDLKIEFEKRSRPNRARTKKFDWTHIQCQSQQTRSQKTKPYCNVRSRWGKRLNEISAVWNAISGGCG